MKSMNQFTGVGIVVALLLALRADFEAVPTEAPKAKTESGAGELYAKGRKAVYAGQYAEAEKLFAEAHQLDPNDADALNMLAYSQRKQGKLTDAFANYDKALQLRPKFPEAREYLGEAHIQAALQQIEILRSYGPEAEEQLGDLIRAFRNAVAKLE